MGRGRGRGGAPPAWGEGSAARAWEDLASADAAKGFAAVRLLRANPEKALAILAERTKPPAVPANLKELVADLGSEDFATRERASAARWRHWASRRVRRRRMRRGADPEAAKRASDLLAH